jgi:hypothetical protein
MKEFVSLSFSNSAVNEQEEYINAAVICGRAVGMNVLITLLVFVKLKHYCSF